MDAALSCLIVGCGYVGSRLARRESTRRPLLALVRSGRSETDLQSAGVRTLRMSGLVKVRAGMTTLEEIISVTNE